MFLRILRFGAQDFTLLCQIIFGGRKGLAQVSEFLDDVGADAAV